MTSHSSTNLFNSCPFSYQCHKEGLHKLAVGPESNWQAWGSAMHAALATHYAGKAGWQEAFLEAYPEDLDPDNQVWSREGGLKTLDAYEAYYAQIDQQWNILAVELPDVTDKRPSLVIDIVAKHKQSGSTYLWDHKFKAKLPFGASRRYELDAQISRYVDFVKEAYGDCAGAVINLVVPGFRQRAYKGEPAGWHWKFERTVIQRTPQQIAYWKNSQLQWEQLISHCEATGLYPKHLGYSCTQCEYLELCVSADDPEVKEALYQVDQSQFEVVIEED